MNKIIIKDTEEIIFDDKDNSNADGKILSGDYNLKTSLNSDELPIDTMRIVVRYPLTDLPNTKLTSLPFGTECTYYQNEAFFEKFYLDNVKRTGKFEYTMDFQSVIGLLKSRTHYGGIYNNVNVTSIINEIMRTIPQEYQIEYTIDEYYNNKRVSGWLPIAPASENLNQVLFLYGGTVTDNKGVLNITTLQAKPPVRIPDSNILQGGTVNFGTPINAIKVTEHQFTNPTEYNYTEQFNGILKNSKIISPMNGQTINGALVRFKKPMVAIKADNGNILESGANYCIVEVKDTQINCKITGVPYNHSTNIIPKGVQNERGKTAEIQNSTLISARNSNTVGDRVLRTLSRADILNTEIISDNLKPKDSLIIRDSFDDIRTGYVQNIEGTMSKNIVKSDSEILLNYAPYDPENPKALYDFIIQKPPKKVKYATNEFFEKNGAEFIAIYTDGSSEVVTNYTYSPTEPLQLTDKEAIFYYTYGDITKVVSVPIKVSVLPIALKITKSPDKVIYNIGDTLDLTGIEIEVTYSDGATKPLTASDYDYFPKGVLTGQYEDITFTYQENGREVSTILTIFFNDAKKLMSIAVTTNPYIMEYSEGTYFDPTGMVVTGTFEDGSTREIKGYTYSPTTPLKKGQDIITIEVLWNKVKYNTKLRISNYYLSYLQLKQPPKVLTYYEGDIIDNSGLILIAHYSNSSKDRVLSPYEYTFEPNVLSYADTYVTYNYIERGIKVSVEQDVTVNYYPYEYTKSIVITNEQMKEKYGDFWYHEKYPVKDIIPDITHKNIRLNYIGLSPMYKRLGVNFSKDGFGNDAYGTDRKILTITNDMGPGTFLSEPGKAGKGTPCTKGSLPGPITSVDVIIPTLDSSTFEFEFDWTSYLEGEGGHTWDEPYYNDIRVPRRIARFGGGISYKDPIHPSGWKKNFKVVFDKEGSQTEGFTDIFTGEVYATIIGEDGTVNGGDGGEAGQRGQDIPGFKGGNPSEGNDYWEKNPIIKEYTDPNTGTYYKVTISAVCSPAGGGGAGYQSNGGDGVVATWGIPNQPLGDNGGSGRAYGYAPRINAQYGSGCPGAEGMGGGGAGGRWTVTVTENIPGACKKVEPYEVKFWTGVGGRQVSQNENSDIYQYIPKNKGGDDAFIIYYS